MIEAALQLAQADLKLAPSALITRPLGASITQRMPAGTTRPMGRLRKRIALCSRKPPARNARQPGRAFQCLDVDAHGRSHYYGDETATVAAGEAEVPIRVLAPLPHQTRL